MEDWDVAKNVGRFFEDLAKKMLNGSECPSDEADMANWKGDVGVECKASDNIHPFRIEVTQLWRHVESWNLGFPFRHYAYCLFKYERERKPKNGKRKSLHKMCRNRERLRLFLAQRDITAHILDIEVVKALHERLGSAIGAFPGGPASYALTLPHAYLARFGEDDSVFAELKLDPREWEIVKTPLVVPFEDGLLVWRVSANITRVFRKERSKVIGRILWKDPERQAVA
jgi:hypothetical protein